MPLMYPLSPARWAVLAALAEATEPLDRRTLSALTGVTHCNVRDTMQRPVNAGWVTTTKVPNSRVSGYKYLYEITALGREQLAAHLKEAP